MPFDSNGTFNRVIPGGWKADAAAGIKIRADRHDDEDDGFATGLSTCITKDGRTQPTANIPLNNKKITALGEPTNPNDAATKNYVDNFKTFSTGAVISGAGPINGMIQFTSPVGVNGIGWANADMSWVGKVAEANKHLKRLVINDAATGIGTDLYSIYEDGTINHNGWEASNYAYDGVNNMAIANGYATAISYQGNRFSVLTNDVATTTPYGVVALRSIFSAESSGGHSFVTLNKASGNPGRYSRLYGSVGIYQRWTMDLGDGIVETGGRAGSNFAVHSYDNAGTGPVMGIHIARDTNLCTIGGALHVNGTIVNSPGANLILSATGGGLFFRPNGAGSVTSEVTLDSAGNIALQYNGTGSIYANRGYQCRGGMSGTYGGNIFNFLWQSPYMHAYIDGTYMGAIMWQSDYRFKKDIKPLPSMWDKVKTLNPVQYSIKNWGLYKKDDTPRWGFIAHEMQEKLHPAAATGKKDEKDTVQQVDPMTLVAALTKALQEAMTRIEALEAKVAA